jgi:hypothetical protein
MPPKKPSNTAWRSLSGATAKTTAIRVNLGEKKPKVR